MGIKTDYLKDCTTLETITIQEIVNLKRTTLSTDALDTSLDSLTTEVNDKYDAIKIYIDDALSDIENTTQVQLDATLKEVDSKIEEIKTYFDNEIVLINEEIAKIYRNNVIQFQYFTSTNILRNMNNDIIRIDFDNGYRIETDYVNLVFSDQYENYFPSKITYFDNNDVIVAIEKINIKDNSIIGVENKETTE
jgi:hypothetical protein